MKPKKSVDAYMYGLLTLLTVGSLGYQYHRSTQRADAPAGSALSAGAALPALSLRPLSASDVSAAASDALPLPVGCRVLVVFHPDCPMCHSSAAREKNAPTNPATLPIVWVSGFDDKKSREFTSLVRPGSLVRYDPGAPKALKITAIPTAFLLSKDDLVLGTWAYTGLEDHQELRQKC